ncbi:MAG TPA: flagellar protein FliS, partial [Kofleriaceae bacterium]
MYSRSAANAYRRVDLESAPKYQIVDRLYERFARDVEEARNAIHAKDISGKAKALDHALCIA